MNFFNLENFRNVGNLGNFANLGNFGNSGIGNLSNPTLEHLCLERAAGAKAKVPRALEKKIRGQKQKKGSPK